MKHLDTLLDELQEPVAQLMDWCKEDQDRAIVACFKDLCGLASTNIFELFHEAYPNAQAAQITYAVIGVAEEIMESESEGLKPDIDYIAFYGPLEHIINDRIDLYNRS